MPILLSEISKALVGVIHSLLPSLALTLGLQLISGAVFCAVNPFWTFGDAIYWCWVTATTVGYGDVSNASQAGRLWACFHMLLSVAMLGEIIATFDDLRAERQKTFARSARHLRERD